MAEYTLSSRIFGMLKKEGKCVDELLIARTRYHNLNHSEEPPSRIDLKDNRGYRQHGLHAALVRFHISTYVGLARQPILASTDALGSRGSRKFPAPTARANVDGGGRDKKYASSLVCAGRLLSRVAGLEPRLFTKGDQPAPSDVMSPPAGRLGSAKKEPEELAKSDLAAGFTEVPYPTASKVAVRLTARVFLALLTEEEGTKKMENKTGVRPFARVEPNKNTQDFPHPHISKFALRKLAARSSPPAGGSRMDRFGLKSTGPSTAARPSSVRAKTECARASKPFWNRSQSPNGDWLIQPFSRRADISLRQVTLDLFLFHLPRLGAHFFNKLTCPYLANQRNDNLRRDTLIRLVIRELWGRSGDSARVSRPDSKFPNLVLGHGLDPTEKASFNGDGMGKTGVGISKRSTYSSRCFLSTSTRTESTRQGRHMAKEAEDVQQATPSHPGSSMQPTGLRGFHVLVN
ncbi:uncharacterized protein CLUP02_16331 [Colletotrichum lupini]|uniref:Uncharacterized protein n=1 Tax=Colletotrichum lupini TaxID=145971 RepID=A0A9Q8WPJ9_9PEZI|nr:uncharacterized protein CLUP02_16331 [Colletotrichum lupini]UQC90801.1 hypothetical protein CLUP02_16331 [Colletotrichum lupini]